MFEIQNLKKKNLTFVSAFIQNHMSEMFAFHATMMSNTLGTSIVVFTRSGFMAILLSHYRPSGTIFAFTDEYVDYLKLFICSSVDFYQYLLVKWLTLWLGPISERVRQRLALYQGVCPIQMEFSNDAEKTFEKALSYLQVIWYSFTLLHMKQLTWASLSLFYKLILNLLNEILFYQIIIHLHLS